MSKDTNDEERKRLAAWQANLEKRMAEARVKVIQILRRKRKPRKRGG